MSQEWFGIILQPLVESVRAIGYSLNDPTLKFYPDGSLRWAGLTDFPNTVLPLLQSRVPSGVSHCMFRNPAAWGGGPFEGPTWLLTYPGTYGEKLSRFDEAGLLLEPGQAKDISDDERDPSHFKVRIQFYRRVTERIANDLVSAVRHWFTEVGSRGVFGELGISSLSAKLLYEDKEADFEIDAHASGQDTLNTLYIALIKWGMAKGYPLEFIEVGVSRHEAVLKSDKSIGLSET